MRQFTPPISYVHPRQTALFGGLGVSVEGSRARVPGDDRFHDLSSVVLTLPVLDPYGKATYFDVYSTGTEPVPWNVTTEDFVQVTEAAGTLNPDSSTDSRIYVTIDWEAAPPGSGSTLLNFSSIGGYGTQTKAPSLKLYFNNTKVPDNFTSGFVESQGHLAIEPEHYTNLTNPQDSHVSVIVLPGYGRTLSALKLNDSLAPSLTTETAPLIEYDFYKFTPPSANASHPKYLNVTAVLGTGLNNDPSRHLAFAIGFDDLEPKRIEHIGPAPPGRGARPIGWTDAVYNAAWLNVTSYEDNLDVGPHTLKVWLLEPGTVLSRILINFGGLRDSYLGPAESYRIG